MKKIRLKESYVNREKLIAAYVFVNVFTFMAWFFDFGVSYAVFNANMFLFVKNELNFFFVKFTVMGDYVSLFVIVFLNLFLYIPFIVFGWFYIKSDIKSRMKTYLFWTFVNTAALSFIVGLMHLEGGLGWLWI